MSIEFRYRAERGIQRPVAKVTLTGPNGRNVVEYMYIDSGADFTHPLSSGALPGAAGGGRRGANSSGNQRLDRSHLHDS